MVQHNFTQPLFDFFQPFDEVDYNKSQYILYGRADNKSSKTSKLILNKAVTLGELKSLHNLLTNTGIYAKIGIMKPFSEVQND